MRLPPDDAPPQMRQQFNTYTNLDEIIGGILLGVLAPFSASGVPLVGIQRTVMETMASREFWEAIAEVSPDPKPLGGRETITVPDIEKVSEPGDWQARAERAEATVERAKEFARLLREKSADDTVPTFAAIARQVANALEFLLNNDERPSAEVARKAIDS